MTTPVLPPLVHETIEVTLDVDTLAGTTIEFKECVHQIIISDGRATLDTLIEYLDNVQPTVDDLLEQLADAIASAGSGGAGGSGGFTVEYGETLAVGDPVYIASDGKAYKASRDDWEKSQLIGFAAIAYPAGRVGAVVTGGKVSQGGWAFTPGSRVYLDLNGTLTHTPPETGHIVLAGEAISANSIVAIPNMASNVEVIDV